MQVTTFFTIFVYGNEGVTTSSSLLFNFIFTDMFSIVLKKGSQITTVKTAETPDQAKFSLKEILEGEAYRLGFGLFEDFLDVLKPASFADVEKHFSFKGNAVSGFSFKEGNKNISYIIYSI